MDGEIQILVNNNAADNTKDQTASSTEWKAIIADGSVVDPGTPGTLKYDATGVDGAGGIQLNTTITSQSDGSTSASTDYRSLTAVSGLTAPGLLSQLGLYPQDSNFGNGRVYMRNVGERLPWRGGSWSNTSNAGVPSLSLNNPRSYSDNNIGFRLAYYR
jgi:hypothetical protein